MRFVGAILVFDATKSFQFSKAFVSNCTGLNLGHNCATSIVALWFTTWHHAIRVICIWQSTPLKNHVVQYLTGPNTRIIIITYFIALRLSALLLSVKNHYGTCRWLWIKIDLIKVCSVWQWCWLVQHSAFQSQRPRWSSFQSKILLLYTQLRREHWLSSRSDWSASYTVTILESWGIICSSIWPSTISLNLNLTGQMTYLIGIYR